MAARFFKGTQVDQNVKFKNKEKQLLKSINWPSAFEQQVNLLKVDSDVIKVWMERRIIELLGTDDEIIISYALEYLDEARKTNQLCPKNFQIYLTGFMETSTPIFMRELWDLLLEAQIAPNGVPQRLIEEKEKELSDKRHQLEQEKDQINRISQHMVSVKDFSGTANQSREKPSYSREQNKVSSRQKFSGFDQKDHSNRVPRKRFDSRDRHESRSQSPHRDRKDHQPKDRHDRTDRRRSRSPPIRYDRHRDRQNERARDRDYVKDRDSEDYHRHGRNHRDDRGSQKYGGNSDKRYRNNFYRANDNGHSQNHKREDRRKRSRSKSEEKRQDASKQKDSTIDRQDPK